MYFATNFATLYLVHEYAVLYCTFWVGTRSEGSEWSECPRVSPYNKTSDVFSPEYKANTSRRIDFSADVITNTSSNIRLYTAFAMHIVGICPNIT
jgi:hypothetical protein